MGSTAEEMQLVLSYLRRHAVEKLAAKKLADLITLKIRSSNISNNKVRQKNKLLYLNIAFVCSIG